MQAFVVVQKNDVALGHFHKLNVFHCHLIQMGQVGIRKISIISIEHIRFIDLRSPIFKTLGSVSVVIFENRRNY